KARRARHRPRPPQARLRPGGRRPPGRGRHPRHAPRRQDRSRERDARDSRRRAAERGLRSLGGHRRRELPGSDRSHRRAGGDAARRRLGAAARRRDRRRARLLAPAHPRPPARLERGVGTRARARPPRRRAGAARRAARLPAWRAHGEAVAWLVGRRLGGGITAELLARLGGAPDDRPLLDTLLMLAPALVQCAAAMSEAWPLAFRANPSVVAMGGLTDSCYMW